MTVVRPARARDETGILGCLRAAFGPFRGEYTPAAFADTVPPPDILRRRMAGGSVFVAEDEGGTIVGTVAASVPEPGEGHLRGMAVSPAWHGRRVAPRLLRRALDELRVAGCARVTLDTTDPLVRAQRFYEARGFARTGRVRDFFGMRIHEFAAAVDGGLAIREAREEDIPAMLSAINAAYLVEREFVKGDRLAEDELRRNLARGTFLVAARSGEPAVACVFVQSKPDGRAYLGLLAVDPSRQGMGLGDLMMTAAERWCRRAGAAAVDILVVNLRTELPPFYARRGFVPDGTAPFEDARRFRPAHFLKMTLALA